MPHRFDPPPIADPITSAKRVNRAMLFVGAACAFVGLRFLLLPGEVARTSVGRALAGPYDDAWSVLYVVGGLLIVVGVQFRLPRLELPGITLATTATLVNGAALLIVSGTVSLSQLPLYALVLWVFDGRARDLKDLPQERRRPHGTDPRPHGKRTERRLMVAGFPAIVLAAGESGPDLTTTILVALLGGGAITALMQVLMYRPQRRTLEANLSKTSVEAAGAALAQAERRADSLQEEVTELEGDLAIAKRRIAELEARVDELERLEPDGGTA